MAKELRDKFGRFLKGYKFSNAIIKKLSLARKGKKFTEDHKKSLGDSKIGNKNPMWRGNNIKYKPLHAWVRRHKVKLELCEECKKVKPYDVANISGKYKRDVNDFKWLCRRCHMEKDGRIDKFQWHKLNLPWRGIKK